MADELIFNEPAPSPIYFGDTTDIGTVKNSDGTYSVNVHSGVTVLPDIDFTDSDGIVSLVPAVKDIVATPHHGADVENSDGSYTAHVNDAATLVVPDITVTKYDGSTYTYPAAKDLTESTQIPARRHDNSDGYDYCGTAHYGSAESSEVWTITRIQVQNDGTTVVTHAYNAKWTDRLTENYA